MPRYRLDLESPPDWQPLERVIGLAVRRVSSPQLRVGAFMSMGRLVARSVPAVHLYKHIVTRRYLNLDRGGHAYRLDAWSILANGRTSVHCVLYRSLFDALAETLRWDVGVPRLTRPMSSWPSGSGGVPGW